MKLHTTLGNSRGNKILIAADFVGVKIEQINHDWDDLTTPEYLKINPNAKVPVLETEAGSLYESNAILRYVGGLNPSINLLGADLWAQGHVNQWLDWAVGELEPAFSALLYPVWGWSEPQNAIIAKALEDALKSLQILEKHLKLNSFLVGTSITIADISLASLLVSPLKYIFEADIRKQFVSIMRWFDTVSSQAPFRRAFGKVHLCQKSFINLGQTQQAQAQPKAVKEQKPAQAEKKPAAQAEKKPEAKKETVKKPAAAAEVIEEKQPEDKEKNPLDSLPPSSFPLYDFKTLFVNAPNKQEAIDYLWKNYDANGYSLYHVHYIKYEGEGKVLFQTSNLKNGFIQRLDHFRKYAFGVHGVYGEEPNLEIRGVWLWRGNGIPNEIKELDTFEYHTWTKLDHNSEHDRKRLQEYWTGLHEGAHVDGLPAKDVSYFK